MEDLGNAMWYHGIKVKKKSTKIKFNILKSAREKA